MPLGSATPAGQYGSFEPGNFGSYHEAEYSSRSGLGGFLENLLSTPLNRSLAVLVIFGIVGFLTVLVDHSNVPKNAATTKTTTTAERWKQDAKYGAVAELGLRESKLTMYHWPRVGAAATVVRSWKLPNGVSEYLDKNAGQQDLVEEVKASLIEPFQVAKSSAAEGSPVAATKFSRNAQFFSANVKDAIEQGVEQAMAATGYVHVVSWEDPVSKAGNSNNKKPETWYDKAVAKVGSWEENALAYTYKLINEAIEAKKMSRERMVRDIAKAKEEFQKEKEKVQKEKKDSAAAEHKAKEEAAKKSASTAQKLEREAEASAKKAERKADEMLRSAERKLEQATRKAEEEFNAAAKRADNMERKAETEADKIVRQARARLRKLEERAPKQVYDPPMIRGPTNPPNSETPIAMKQ
jgi:hypothetical protein